MKFTENLILHLEERFCKNVITIPLITDIKNEIECFIRKDLIELNLDTMKSIMKDMKYDILIDNNRLIITPQSLFTFFLIKGKYEEAVICYKDNLKSFGTDYGTYTFYEDKGICFIPITKMTELKINLEMD